MKKKFMVYSHKWDKLVSESDKDYSLHLNLDGSAILWMDSCDDEVVRVLQYVGCHDINDVEIYEGFVIENIKTKSQYYIEDIVEFHLWASRNSIDVHKSHTVIGNIYQNDDLYEKYYKVN